MVLHFAMIFLWSSCKRYHSISYLVFEITATYLTWNICASGVVCFIFIRLNCFQLSIFVCMLFAYPKYCCVWLRIKWTTVPSSINYINDYQNVLYPIISFLTQHDGIVEKPKFLCFNANVKTINSKNRNNVFFCSHKLYIISVGD